MMKMLGSVTLREVGPRDGFQSLKRFVPTDQKLRIIEAVARAGVAEIETTSFVSPKALPQMADAGELMGKVPHQGVVHAAMVPNVTGARHALSAGVDRLVVVISASEAHNRANVRRSIRRSVDGLDTIFGHATPARIPVTGALAVAFGCPFQGDVPETSVYRLAGEYVSRGADSVILADTTGMASPLRVEKMVRQFKDRFPDTRLILHFHNNRGVAMANLLAALAAGADTFDTAVGGIGGCPYVPRAAGNLATEDVVFMLEDMGIHTGIDLALMIEAAQKLEKILGYTLPGQVMKSGPRNPKHCHRSC